MAHCLRNVCIVYCREQQCSPDAVVCTALPVSALHCQYALLQLLLQHCTAVFSAAIATPLLLHASSSLALTAHTELCLSVSFQLLCRLELFIQLLLLCSELYAARQRPLEHTQPLEVQHGGSVTSAVLAALLEEVLAQLQVTVYSC
jgi:hypothetical protein